MERLNKETLSFPALRIARVIATLGMVFALVACGDKGGGGAVAPTPVYPNGCMTCSGITNPVVLTSFSMQSSDGSSWYGGGQASMIFQNMQIFGQSSNYASATSYQGPIAVQGTLVVTKPVADVDGYGRQITGCILQPGTYYVQSNGSAQMGGYGQFQIPSMVSTSLTMELIIDAASNGGGLVGQSALAIVQIRSISGIQCSSNFYGQFGPSGY
jgi:hypothetical protein